MRSAPTYLTLSPACSLRLLERPCIFDKARDELYELDDEAFEFAQRLPFPIDGEDVLGVDGAFLEYCLDEAVLVQRIEPRPIKHPVQSPTPSLRYLLLHITTRCNLRCAHCFHGNVEPLDMPVERIERILTEFDTMQGLRLLVSGGEPPLHPQFAEINELFDRFSFRTIILSNGALFEDRSLVERLKAHEVQVSLDGVGPSHDALRGAGSYEKALGGLQTLASADIDVSVATMAHAANADDFDELEAVVKSVGAKEWNIDAPAKAGRWGRNGRSGPSGDADDARALSLDRIGAIFGRGFGGGAHFSGEAGWACGAHLCAVMADGTVCKCGFYANSPSGSTDAGLLGCWQNTPRLKTESLRCDCDMVEECRGGCRYRAEVAGDPLGVDPVMCAANGLPQ